MPTFDTPDPISARINNPSGSVSVHAGSAGTTTVDVSSSGRDEAANTRVDYRNGTLRVEVPRHRDWGRSPDIDITVELPAGSSIQVDTSSADVELTGTVGEVQVTTASGDVELDEATGSVRVQTASGEVEVDLAQAGVSITTASGDIRLDEAGGHTTVETASGDVGIDRVAGDLQVRAASGDIRVDDVAGNLSANSASGDLTIGQLHRGTAEVQTASGDVTIGVTDGVPIWLDLHSLSGDVDTAQQADAGPGESDERLELRVNTVSGDITVRRAS